MEGGRAGRREQRVIMWAFAYITERNTGKGSVCATFSLNVPY